MEVSRAHGADPYGAASSTRGGLRSTAPRPVDPADAARAASSDARLGVAEERPFLHLVGGESCPQAERGPHRVLVVDDDPAARKLCSVILELADLDVAEAANGRAGLEQARLRPPDLIVTDVMMPGLDGFGLVEGLREQERTRSVPVVFLSGEPDVGSRARASELGAAAYVTKPFNPVGFASLVVRVLAERDKAAAAVGGNAGWRAT